MSALDHLGHRWGRERLRAEGLPAAREREHRGERRTYAAGSLCPDAEAGPDEPCTDGSVFDLASLTKVIGLTTATLLLADGNRLAVDAPVPFLDAQLVADARHIIDGMRIGPDDAQVAVIPLSHSYGLSVLVLPLLVLYLFLLSVLLGLFLGEARAVPQLHDAALAGIQLLEPLFVQVRAHGAPVRGRLDGDVVRFSRPQPRVAPGQVVALYRAFDLGRRYRATPFWQAVRRLHGLLNPGAPLRASKPNAV